MRSAAVLATALFSPLAAAAGWGGSLGVTTDYIFRGVSQSDGRPSAQADGHYYANAGWYAGLWAATVKLEGDDEITAELNAYAGYSFALAESWSGTVSFVHYDYPWNHPRSRYVYDELVGTLGYADRVFVTIAASPDTAFSSIYGDAGRSAAFAYDLALHWPVWSALSANAGIGYRDVHRQLGEGYLYWNAGVGYDWRDLQLQLAYIGSSAAAARLFGDDAAHDWTLSALWHF